MSPPGDPSERFVSEHFAQANADTGIDRALRLDSTVMLVDDPVKRVDNMTMAWGLEGRVRSSTTKWSSWPRRLRS